MNLITIFSLYPDQEACIEHLEISALASGSQAARIVAA